VKTLGHAIRQASPRGRPGPAGDRLCIADPLAHCHCNRNRSPGPSLPRNVTSRSSAGNTRSVTLGTVSRDEVWQGGR
jgi:hypothetical protein